MANSSIFRDAAQGLMAADVQPQGQRVPFRATQANFLRAGGVRPLDTSSNARILVLVQTELATAPPITLVMNWDAELKK